MKDFGLVVVGAHFGVWLEGEIAKYKNQNILLVEPVPYNYEILKKKFSKKKIYSYVPMRFFLKIQKKIFFL